MKRDERLHEGHHEKKRDRSSRSSTTPKTEDVAAGELTSSAWREQRVDVEQSWCCSPTNLRLDSGLLLLRWCNQFSESLRFQ